MHGEQADRASAGPGRASSPRPATEAEVPATYDEALAWFTAERQTLVAMVESAAAGFDGRARQLAQALQGFLCLRGDWDGLATVERIAVAVAQRASDPAALARARRNLGQAEFRLGRFDEAREHLHHAVDLFRHADDPLGQAGALMFLARVRARRGHHAEALDHARQALLLYRSADEPGGRAEAFNAVGWYHSTLGDQEQAIASYREAFAQFVELGDRRGQAITWHNLGDAEYRLGRHDRAAVCYRHALGLRRDLGDRDGEGVLLARLGDAYSAAGDVEAARDTWERTLAVLDAVHRFDADRVRTKLAALGARP
nr:hypothetical protein GCM10020093_008980 [Planobispora longispora]